MGKCLADIVVREKRLRWPVELGTDVLDECLLRVERRGKYLLFRFRSGALIIHLGMLSLIHI